MKVKYSVEKCPHQKTNVNKNMHNFRQTCKEQGVGLSEPYGSLPTQDILLILTTLTITCCKAIFIASQDVGTLLNLWPQPSKRLLRKTSLTLLSY